MRQIGHDEGSVIIRSVFANPAENIRGDTSGRGLAGQLCRNASLPETIDDSVGAEKEAVSVRSEEHTSELQSRTNLVCRLLLEKKKN